MLEKFKNPPAVTLKKKVPVRFNSSPSLLIIQCADYIICYSIHDASSTLFKFSVTGSADSQLSPALRLPPPVTVIATIHQRPNPFTGESQQTVTSDKITEKMIGYIWTKQPDCVITKAQSPAR